MSRTKSKDGLNLMEEDMTGVALTVMRALKIAMRERKGRFAEFSRLATPAGADDLDQIADIIVGSRRDYPLVVDYDKSLIQMVRTGRFATKDWWYEQMACPKHYRIQGRGQANVNALLIRKSECNVGFPKIRAELKRHGWRSADLFELLAFAAQYRQIMKLFPIVAPSVVWREDHHGYLESKVPYIVQRDDRRYLDLVDWGGDQMHDCRLLVVRR